MPTRLSRTSACCRRFAGREALTVDATFAGALRACPPNLRNGQSFPDKSIGSLGELLWLTLWYSNSWAWRCSRCVSSCWPFRRRDGLPGTSATPDRSCSQTDVLTGSGLPAIQQLRPGGSSLGENSPKCGNARLEFAARPLTYQRFRQNAVAEALWTVHGPDYHHLGTRRGLRPARETPGHHRRYRIPAGDHLLSAALRRADGERGGSGRDRHAGPWHRPQAVPGADG